MSKEFELFYPFDLTDPSRYHYKVIDGEYFDWLFSHLAGTGLTFLYRMNAAGRCYYPSRHMTMFDHASVDYGNPDAQYWHRVPEALEGSDLLAEAVQAAKRHGVKVWAWWNWNEWQNIRQGYIDLVDREWYDKPRKYWCSRDGSRFFCGVPDWGDEEVRQRLLALTDESLAYDIEGMYLSTRSHSWWPCWPTPGWDEHLEPFGFNDSVVEDYRKAYGVDIRFEDYDEDKWLEIKGRQFSTLLSRVGHRMHGKGKRFIIGIQPDRYNLMVDYDKRPTVQALAEHLRLYKDWEAWAGEGSIDGICAEKACPGEQELAGADISLFQETLPEGFPTYSWLDTTWWVNRGAGPFSLENWCRGSVEEVLKQIDMAEDSGAAGAFLHSLYHYTGCDTQGRELQGYGVLPRTEYFDALRKRQGNRA